MATLEALMRHLSSSFPWDDRGLDHIIVLVDEAEQMGRPNHCHPRVFRDAEHTLEEPGFFVLIAADLDANESVMVDLLHGLLNQARLLGRGEPMLKDKDSSFFDLLDDEVEFLSG